MRISDWSSDVCSSDLSRAATIERLLKGAIDLHCHSGPSVMPRDLDHIEAIKEASDAGLRAILFKDHFYSADPIAALLRRHFSHLNVDLLYGVADREGVVAGMRGAVRVDRGGRPIINKKRKNKKKK